MEKNLSITALSAVLLLLFAEIQISSCAFVTDPYANISTPLRETMRNQHLGVIINVHLLKFQENFMLEKMKNFEILTGVCIQKIYSTTETWYDDVLVDIRDNSPGFIDLYASFGNWIPQYAELNGLKDLTNETRNAVGLDWFDIMPAVRKGTASYKQKVYSIPLDGDVIYMLYRKDLVEDVGLPTPRSWDDVHTILKYYDGKDINGDGVPDFGNCFSTAEVDIAGTIFWAIASSFLQTRGTAQGTFFDPKTMEPISSSPKFIEVLEVYDKLVQHSPFAVNATGVSWTINRELFNQKKCVLFYNYPGAIKSIISAQKKNGMAGTLNLASLPGKKCAENEDCPFASKHGVNHAPFLAGGGMAYAVNNRVSKEKQKAALDFAFYLSDPGGSFWDVAHPESFLDPLRLRHTSSLSNNRTLEAKAFLEFGWENRQLSMLKEITEFSFLNDNYVYDLRNLGASDYQQGGTVPHLIDMWNGKASAEETASAITKHWKEITAQYGLEEQRAFYRNVLGLPKYIDPFNENNVENLRIIIAVVTIPFAVLAIILLFVVLKQRRTIKFHTRDVNNAPKTGTIALLFTDIEDSTVLWDTDKQAMGKALEIHHNVIRTCIDKFLAYEVKTVGDAFMIAVNSADKAILLANNIQLALLNADWPLELARMPSSCVAYFPQPRKKKDPPKLMFSGLRVRIGIHLGQHSIQPSRGEESSDIQVIYDEVTKGFDYYGQVVNITARVGDVGFGGQTVITKEVYDALSERVKIRSSYLHIGSLSLRGVQNPMSVHSCLPQELKDRRFQGLYRKRRSLGSVELKRSLTTDTNSDSIVKSIDVMSLTPVELQNALLKMITIVSSLKEQLSTYKTTNGREYDDTSDNKEDEVKDREDLVNSLSSKT